MALSLSTSPTFSLYTHPNLLSLKSQPQRHLLLSPTSFTPLRSSSIESRNGGGLLNLVQPKRRRFGGAVCYSGGGAALFSPRNLQWIGTIASAVLMVAKGTPIQKSFIVPIFALQAPAAIVSWIKGEYGVWTVFLALLIRLFFFIPGELELPFIALLVVLVAPNQVMNLRGKQEGVILSLAIAAYLAFQHFLRAGSLQKAFDQGSVIATICIICVLAVPCLLLVGF
ncbi:Cold-regulated 413 inner membrane protein 2, chloroplastic [Heracleum sosnowskyi]|uniref:Cold-regulated 413 inner membrane protein 2, chloroplastic n=1 Tax=Heracleum sosnowskyi TaxID=360622 RepID=A0AAD8GMD3_9APIA|nr:Cold-regulated 413 inner membrane protein 2, chloroplastic [Heracleum sosnowskyi]